MRRSSAALICCAALALVPLHTRVLIAQAQQAETPKDPGGLKVLNVGDYGRWNRIGGVSLSSDGKWITYSYQSGAEAATLHIKQIDGDKLHTIAVGPAAGGGRGGADGGTVFSPDSRWIGYFVNPPQSGARGAGDGGRGRGGAVPSGGREAGAAPTTPSTRRLEVLNVATGEKFEVPGAAGFRFSKTSKWLIVRMAKTSTDTTYTGTDLVVRDLGTGGMRNIGNVAEFDIDDSGRLLAYTVDVGGKLGNGVYVVDLASSETRTLATAASRFDGLAWSQSGTNLLALRGEKAKTRMQRDNVLLAWTDVSTPRQRLIEYDASTDAGFPKGMVLSEFAPPRWSGDGTRIFVGIKEQDAEVPSSPGPKANVDVWHWNDAVLQSVQIVRLQQLRRATYPSVFLVESKKVVQWGDSLMGGVTRTTSGRWAVGKVDTAYAHAVTWQNPYADFYRIDGETGGRTLIEKKLLRTMGTSPDGRWFVYLKNKHVYAYDLETGKSSVVDGGMDFVNIDDDFTYEKGIWGVAGWAKDGKSLLLYDKFDLWQMPVDGGKPVNLTKGVGKAQQISFCVTDPATGRGGRVGSVGGSGGSRCGDRPMGGGRGDDETGIDLSKPIMLSAYGEWTKKTGYWTLTAGDSPKPLVWLDKQVGPIVKATQADRIAFTEQTFQEFPDYWVSDLSFASPRKITDANPILSEYAWGRKILVDYKNSKGQRLQGTLTLPAGYVQGKRYPMVVVFYQTMSDQQHIFSTPAFNSSPQPSTYASNGYLVFQPDIVYEVGHPGTSALDCITAAVKQVIELGYADPKRIGLQGHSWSGYQSSFLVTQTDMFAAVVTGAPPTNLISFYNELYKSSGAVQQGITELSQVRMGDGVTPWNAHDLYESQSPLFNAPKIKTPFLIYHGTADGAVDWVEGLQLYNAARRLGKEVIFLSYPDEGHSLGRRENQIDFQIRMKQYFDHYLLGKPAAKWITEGVAQLKKGRPIE